MYFNRHLYDMVFQSVVSDPLDSMKCRIHGRDLTLNATTIKCYSRWESGRQRNLHNFLGVKFTNHFRPF